MEKNELIVAILPETISAREFDQEKLPLYWAYFGKNYFSKSKIKKRLDNIFLELDISRSLEEVANEIRSEHVEWIDGINERYGSELEWWFGNIASRNIYSSDLFQYCCYLVLLERLWESPTKKPSLIVVESPALALTISHWAQKRNIRSSIKGRYKFYTKKSFNYSKFYLRWLDFIITSVMRKLASVVLNKKDIIEKSQSCDMVMISTFVSESSISDSGIFNDRYFPYLHEYLKKNNKNVLIHPVFYGFGYNFFSIFKKISRSSEDFLIQEKYLKPEDYFYAWIYPVQILKQKIVVPEFHGFNLTGIIQEDQMRVDVQNVMQAILIFRLIQKLGENNLKLHLFIDWYENQILNRAITAGLHNAFPGLKTIGAQILLHAPNFLSLFPSRSESKAGIVPDTLLATSHYQCGLARAFSPSIRCIPAAALRYSHVFTEQEQSAPIKDSHEEYVLVLTTFNQDETIELLQIMHEIMKALSDNVKIYIRFHPDIRIQDIIKYYPGIRTDRRFMIHQGSLSGGIREASVVVSNGSGSIVEALAKGTPGIFVGNQNKLNINPLSGINTPLFTECYSNDEVIEALLKYLNLSDNERDEYRNLGKSIRDMFFLPVNEETLSPFLES